DGTYSAVADNSKFLDVVDQAWADDSLSDDELDLPDGVEVPNDVAEVLGIALDATDQEEDRWQDLGLDNVLQREGGFPH
ncbi:unnamed protein product, partial [Phaeothamnion confervicola]